MYEMTAGAGEERVPQRRFTLPSILLVAATLAFVTALILLSGEPSPAWFFYLLPIIIGALVYDVAGGVIMTALAWARCSSPRPPRRFPKAQRSWSPASRSSSCAVWL